MWPNRRTGHYENPQEMEEESDDEAFHEDDVLLFTSLDSYVLRVISTGMASTSCLEPVSSAFPHMVYYPAASERTRSPERDIVSSPIRQNNDADQTDEESDHPLSEDDMSLNTLSGQTTPETELTPILFKRPTRLTMPTTRRKDTPIPEPALDRRRLRVSHKMAAVTRLNSQVANRVVKYARSIRNVYESEMGCLNCGLLPLCPITGQCGHTRCTDCVLDTIRCPCGYEIPNELSVNILIRDLVEKTTSKTLSARSSRIVPVPASVDVNTEDVASGNADIKINPMNGAGESCRGHIRLAATSARAHSANFRGPKRIPMSPRARYNHALALLRLGRYREAVPYLAIAAASGQPDLRRARPLLTQVITVLSNNRDPRHLVTQLTRSVRRLSSTSWIKTRDMECILCRDIYINPVTTPCGHMFCRTCLERALDYGKRCPLCLRDLIGFMLSETENTLFVQAALKSINANVTPLPLEPDLIPIFVCTVAYPSVPCPLFIFDPRYWLMIRRVLETGSRKFGMVAYDRGQDYVDYGTILEVRDCVHLEDGRSILSTIGLSRFKVIERGVRDGCDMARILPITDVVPRDPYEIWDIKMLAQRIMLKALLWLSRLSTKVLADIEAAFGALESCDFSEDSWWESTDGPPWLWWLVTVLPLRSEIKVLILSTNCLIKRMMAVVRTLEALEPGRPSPSQNILQNTLPAANAQTMQHDGT